MFALWTYKNVFCFIFNTLRVGWIIFLVYRVIKLKHLLKKLWLLMPKKISKYCIFSYNCVQSGFNPLISYNKTEDCSAQLFLTQLTLVKIMERRINWSKVRVISIYRGIQFLAKLSILIVRSIWIPHCFTFILIIHVYVVNFIHFII